VVGTATHRLLLLLSLTPSTAVAIGRVVVVVALLRRATGKVQQRLG